MINIRFSPLAFMKMQTLVNGYDKEVGWYGTTEKVADHDFRIIDIIVPPQYTSAAYISDCKDDPLEFQKWLDTLDDDTYNSKRFHGHSHVNMTVSPSGTDNEFFNAFSHTNSMATINSYTIDLIINKKLDMHWWVMDEDGTEYKNKDISWTVEVQPGVTIDEFFESTKNLVKDIYSPSQFLWGGSTGFKTAGSSYVKTKADREAEKNKTKVSVVNNSNANNKKDNKKTSDTAKNAKGYNSYYGYDIDEDPWDDGYDDWYYGSGYYGYKHYNDDDDFSDRAYMVVLDKKIEVVDITNTSTAKDKDDYYCVYDDMGDVYFFNVDKMKDASPNSIGHRLYNEAHSHGDAGDPEVTFFIDGGNAGCAYWEILGGRQKIEVLEEMLNTATDDVETSVFKSGKIERTEITFTIKEQKEEGK